MSISEVGKISLDLSELKLKTKVTSEFDLHGDHWLVMNFILLLNVSYFIFQAFSLMISNNSSLGLSRQSVIIVFL